MTALDTFISQLQGGKYSANPQNLIAQVDAAVAALQSLAPGNPGVFTTLEVTGNGAANVSPSKFDGTIFSGGSATSTKPLVLIEPAGTLSTGWSTFGTYLGINAAAGANAGLPLLDLQVAGVSKHFFAANGDYVTQGSLTVQGAGGVFGANTIQLNSTNGAVCANSKGYLWSATGGSNGTPDTGFSRVSAAKVCLGNGTLGNAAGTLQLAGLQFGSAAVMADYQEVTFTPTDASGAGLVFSAASGRAVKSGKGVSFSFSVTYPVTGDATAAAIGSLPFTASNAIAVDMDGAAVTFTNSNRSDSFLIARNTITGGFFGASGTAVPNNLYSGAKLTYSGWFQSAT